VNYFQRNPLAVIFVMLASVAIIIGIGTIIVRMNTTTEMTDAQFERELARRLDGAVRGANATLGVQMDDALKVTGVLPEGPGAAAGVKTGDQLLAVNGSDVNTVDEARTRLAAVPASTEYTVTVNREGARVDLKATKGTAITDLGGLFQRLTERAPQFGRGRPGTEATPQSSPSAPTQGPVLGVSLQAVGGGGLRVLTVMPNSPAATAGVITDDVIVSVSGRPTNTVEGLQTILQSAGPGATVPLVVKRGDQQLTLTAILSPRT